MPSQLFPPNAASVHAHQPFSHAATEPERWSVRGVHSGMLWLTVVKQASHGAHEVRQVLCASEFHATWQTAAMGGGGVAGGGGP